MHQPDYNYKTGMKKILLILLIFSVWTDKAFAQMDHTQQTIYIRIADDASTAINNGEFVKAEQLLLQAIGMKEDNPMNPLLLSNLGMCRFYMGEDSLALATLDDAVSKAPASVTILLNRAKVKLGIGKMESAMRDYNRVIELDSLVSTPYFYRGFYELNKGNLPSAKADFEKLDRLSPDSYEANLAMATLYSSTHQEALAIPYYTKLLKQEKATEFLAGRAYCYLYTGDLYEASNDINAGLEQSPEDGDLYLCRAVLNRMRYLEKECAADAEKAVELGVSHEKVKLVLGEIKK